MTRSRFFAWNLMVVVLGLLMVGILIPQAGWAKAKLSGAKATKFTHGQNSVATDVTAVPSVSGRTVRVFRLNLFVDQADTIAVRCGATEKGAWSFPSAMGLDQDLAPYYYDCDAGDSLNFVKTDPNTNLQYQVWYEQEAN